MTHRFIIEAVRIVDRLPVIADDEDVARREVLAEAGGLQGFGLFAQAVGARGRDVANVVALGDVVRERLMANAMALRAVIQVVDDAHPFGFERHRRDHAVGLFDHDRFANLEDLTRRVLLDDACFEHGLCKEC